MKELSTAPLSKPFGVGEKEHIPTRRDTQSLTSDNLISGNFEFFPESPSGTDHIGRKYNQPLGGGEKRVLSLGFGFTHPIIEASTNVDPIPLFNQLRHSAVVLEIGSRDTRVLRGHLTEFIPFDQFETIEAAYNDGTNNDEYVAVHARSVPLRRLADTSVENTLLKNQQRFNLRIEPKATDQIPAKSDWATDGTPAIIASMQIGYPPGEDPGGRDQSRFTLTR